MSKKITFAVGGASLALLLSACGGSNSSLEDVQYDMNGATAEPSVSFETPFAAGETATHVIEEGNGEEVQDGDELIINASIFSGEDGSSQGTTYPSSPMVIPVSEDLKNNAPELYDVLSGAKVGTSFAYTSNEIPSMDGSEPSEAPKDTPTNVEVYTIAEKLPKEASGEETPKEDINSALDSFTIKDDGSAELKLADKRGDAPKELVSENLIKGDGKKVGENDTVYVRYQGVDWEKGEAFDGNFGSDKATAALSLNQVIDGWKQGLAGKTVGSRVLLLIPSDQAYGDDAPEGQPSGALVFVVDILGATEGQAPGEAPSGSAQPSESAAPQQSAQPSESAK